MENKSTSAKITSQKIWDILKISLAVLGLFYVFSQTDYQQLLALRYKFSWGWFWLTFLAFLSMLGFKTLQYYTFIGRKIPYLHTLEIVIIQNLLMNFVTTVAGIASYLTLLGVEKDVRLGRATESFILVKIGDVIAASVMLLISIFFVHVPPEAKTILILISVFIAGFVLMLSFLILFRERFVEWIKKIILFLKLGHVKIVQKGISYLEKIAAYRQITMLRGIGMSGLLSFAYVGVTMFWAYARLRTLSLAVDFSVIVFIFSILQFASWIPIYVFGGLGVSEGMLIFLLRMFGVNPIGLAAILLGSRVVVYILHASTILYLPFRTTFLHSSSAE